MITVDDFRAEAAAWLDENRATAPPNWGAIMPAERREPGMEWQARMHAAGVASVHWPVEYGGRGLTPEHLQAWGELCTEAGVPAVLNMVGIVLMAGAVQLFGTESRSGPICPRR